MHLCHHGPTSAIRQQVLVDINEQVLLQRGTICGPIALAFQHLLLAGDEPARMWTANFNDEQCAVLQRASKPVLSPDDTSAIKLMFKQFTTIINTGAAVMWFTKIQHHGPAEVKEPPSLVVPTSEAMVAMLNPVYKLGIKPPKATRRPRKPTAPHPKAATTRLVQVTTPSFIGPVQPRRRLVLPTPDPIALQGLSTALTICAPDDILLDVHNLGVQTRSFCTLLPGVWLDDQIIHAHLALLQLRNPNCMYLDLVLSRQLPPHRPTFDYNEIRHMYRRIPLFDKDLILMPININNSHWTLVAMDMVTKTISYYDSMRGNGQLYIDNALAFLQASAEARGIPFSATEWTCDRHAAEAYPPQPNGFDCGIYVGMVADLLTSRLPPRLLTLETMARARTHISMCLWEARAPDLTYCVSYVLAPIPTPAPPVLTQSILMATPKTPTIPLPDSAQVANVLKSIVDRVVKTTCSPPTLTQTRLFPSNTAPTGPPTDSDILPNVPLLPLAGTTPAGGKRLPTKTNRKLKNTTKTPYEKPQQTPPTTSPMPAAFPPYVPTLAPPTPPHASPTPPQPAEDSHTTPHVPTTDPTQTQHTPEAITAHLALPTATAEAAPRAAPMSKPKRRAKYVEPEVPLLDRADRSSRNACGILDTRTVKVIPDAQLTRLPHLLPDTCSLAIGPSQQYDGGQELYLDQTICLPGTIIAYYEGTELSEEEKNASKSRYVFKIPTGPETAIYIDAEDPKSCYARYADDSFYDGTENAHWVETGTSVATRLALE